MQQLRSRETEGFPPKFIYVLVSLLLFHCIRLPESEHNLPPEPKPHSLTFFLHDDALQLLSICKEPGKGNNSTSNRSPTAWKLWGLLMSICILAQDGVHILIVTHMVTRMAGPSALLFTIYTTLPSLLSVIFVDPSIYSPIHPSSIHSTFPSAYYMS